MNDELLIDLVRFTNDPLGFVLWAFPWGEPGSELEHEPGPELWQRQILLDLQHGLITFEGAVRLARTSGHGIGKALGNDTVIDTPQGRRIWDEIAVGDYVFGKNGKPTRVMAVHPQGKRFLYKVAFDDGTSVEACEDHVWAVKGRQQRRNGKDYINLTTKEILRKGVLRANGVAQTKQWEIPTCAPVEWPDRQLPIEPYTLGVWLGDGHMGRITTADQEIKDRLWGDGYRLSSSETKSNADAVGIHGLKVKLRELNLLDTRSNSKYVPREFKQTTSFNRAELLRGLLDTDGECNQAGSIIFNSVSYQLVQDVMWLVRSLGGKAQLQPTVKKSFYPSGDKLLQGQDCYRCTIQMPHDFRSFYIERKQARVVNAEMRYLTRWIASITPVGEKPCQCITVEAEDGLFLANDFIVTHNSALVAWLIWWAMSTMENTIGVVTANTENQLKTKTWVQVATWYRRLICRDMFKMTKTAIFSVDPEYEDTWRFDMVPWSERNTEAFAGLHNKGKRILVVFDEASAIADLIWEVTEGALTDTKTQIVWACFGNPTKNKGRFRDCFAGGKFEKRWNHAAIDSRSVRFTNKVQIKEWIEDYGEDSDFVRVRVRGVFPRVDAESFIPFDLASAAVEREIELQYDPVVLGVDVGRFGDDPSVIYPRRGRDARTLPVEVLYGLDTMRVAAKVAAAFTAHGATIVMVDSGGVGGGVVDRLRQLSIPVMDVDFGSAADGTNPDDGAKYANKRAEIWGGLRQWLTVGSIPERVHGCEVTLVDELCAPNYGLNTAEAIQLESKKEMRRRSVKSPNLADALACTFAFPVYVSASAEELRPTYSPDYNPFAHERMSA